jgi:glutamyl-tRNA synthetase
MAPLVERFDFTHFGRAPARLADEELFALNARILHLLPYEAVASRLPDQIDAAAWAVVQPNVERVAEAADWVPVLAGAIPPPALDADDRAFLTQAAQAAAQIDFAADPWHALTGALKAATGRKGKALFLPLRLALTGRAHGPDMAALLPLIGRARALDRLTAAGEGPQHR